MYYSIRAAAEHIGVVPSTIRYYEREGLLPNISRNNSGIRQFTDKDLDWLHTLECLKKTGMSIKEIKRFVDLFLQGDKTLEERRQMFYERRQAVEGQMAELQKTLDFANYKCWYYDTAVEAGTADVPRNMSPEDIPEDVLRMKMNAKA